MESYYQAAPPWPFAVPCPRERYSVRTAARQQTPGVLIVLSAEFPNGLSGVPGGRSNILLGESVGDCLEDLGVLDSTEFVHLLLRPIEVRSCFAQPLDSLLKVHWLSVIG